MLRKKVTGALTSLRLLFRKKSFGLFGSPMRLRRVFYFCKVRFAPPFRKKHVRLVVRDGALDVPPADALMRKLNLEMVEFGINLTALGF